MTRLLTLLFLFFVTGVSCYLLTVRIKPAAEITDFLPADALAVVEWDNLARSWQGWRRTPSGEKVNQTDFLTFIGLLGFPKSLIEQAQEHLPVLEELTKRSSFQRLFAQKAVLALLPSTDPPPSTLSALCRQLVLALQIEDDLSLDHIFQEEYFASVQSQHTTLYQGEPLVALVFRDGYTLTCWLQRGVLICAQDPALVRRCIDQSLQRMVRVRSGLQLNAAYQRLKQHSPNHSDVFFYANLERLQHWFPMFRANDIRDGELLPRYFSLFHFARGQENRLRLIALVDEETLRAFTFRHQLAPPVEEPATLLVSRDTGFSVWTNWLKLRKLWDFGLQSSNPDVGALMTSVAQQFSETTGRSFDTFFDVFGDGFGVFINEQEVPHQSDRSMGCLAIEVRDRPAVETMIKQLVASLQVITVKSRETEISSVMLAGGLLQPAYALVDNYLILADSVELIEQARQQIRRYPDGRKAEEHWSADRGGNVFLFVRTGDMVERLLPVLTLLAKDTGERTRVLSQENRLFVRELGLPLLAGLRGIATSRLRGYAAGDAILLEVDYSLPRE